MFSLRRLFPVLFLISVILVSGCSQTGEKRPIKTGLPIDSLTEIKINMTSIKFSKGVQYEPVSSILEIGVGERFGPILYGDPPPFAIVAIADIQTATLLFNDTNLVISNDPVNKQYKEKQLQISTKDTCFRTRTLDSGTDTCLKIVLPKDTVASNTTDSYICSQDSDCISVPADFCGCNQGGKATSINKNFESDWTNKLSGEGKACIQVISTDPSCSQEPKCLGKKCALS